jgi:putative oxidoreductase
LYRRLIHLARRIFRPALGRSGGGRGNRFHCTISYNLRTIAAALCVATPRLGNGTQIGGCHDGTLCKTRKGQPYILSVLRIVAALLFLEHGLQKFLGFPSAGPPMTPLLYVQGVIEIVGGLLLLVGLYWRVVAFILAGDTAVAYFYSAFSPLVLSGG